jgi:hypothetical protein
VHFQVFLPGKVGSDPAHLDAVGLADLRRSDDHQPAFMELTAGPGGEPGLLVVWMTDAAQQDLSYRPELQTWVPQSVGPDQTPQYWIGWTTDAPPTPDDLTRKHPIPGRFLQLGDGRFWRVPVAHLVPQVLALAQGAWESRPNPRYRRFVERSAWALDACERALRGDEAVALSEAANYAVEALGWNYRLSPELVSHWGLLRVESGFKASDLFLILATSSDVERLLGIADELQKKAGPPTPSG